MILAGLVLLSIGAADLARRAHSSRHRWSGLAATALGVLLLGALVDAVLVAIAGIAATAVWLWLMPSGRSARAGVWSSAGVLIVCATGVVVILPRERPGILGQAWQPSSPVGQLDVDLVILVAGALTFLLESSNITVRAALGNEISAPSVNPPPRWRAGAGGGLQHTDLQPVEAGGDPVPGAPDAAPASEDPVPMPAPPSLKGGRLIGPLERIVVFALTLASAFTLLAAVLAAKGIVRFPEISRDENGDRAEYFLVGSLVSWVIALAVALVVWWGYGSALV